MEIYGRKAKIKIKKKIPWLPGINFIYDKFLINEA